MVIVMGYNLKMITKSALLSQSGKEEKIHRSCASVGRGALCSHGPLLSCSCLLIFEVYVFVNSKFYYSHCLPL